MTSPLVRANDRVPFREQVAHMGGGFHLAEFLLKKI